MKYIRTKLATDWDDEKDLSVRALEKFLWFIPKANPGYDDKLHTVKEWVIEFEDDGIPFREIGLNQLGFPVLAGPSKDDYGFWLGSNMKFEDFEGLEMEASEFEGLWIKSNIKVST